MSRIGRKHEIGLYFNTVPSNVDAVLRSIESNFEFCCIPLVYSQVEDIADNSIQQCYKLTKSDITLREKDYDKFVYAKLSDCSHINSSSGRIRKLYENMLDQEIKWGSFLETRGLMFTLPALGPLTNLARVINTKLKAQYRRSQFVVEIPMVYSLTDSHGEEMVSMWSRWNTFRMLCDMDNKLTVALEISEDLPSEEELDRWRGEPLKFILLKSNVFITDDKGLPQLPQSHEKFIVSLNRRVALIISGVGNSSKTLDRYSHYLKTLQKAKIDSVLCTTLEQYEDILTSPLQPLVDNLESYTYEVFEKDNVKYTKYQKAILNVILDKRDNNGRTTLVLMVVGAGRGPLVNCALLAAKEAKCQLKVYAVEKNPFAIITLRDYKFNYWKNDKVEIVHCDMRYWNAPEKADIIVSELLGSFGDNELSPECLDGVMHHLKSDGVSIPKSYASYVCPIQCPTLYQRVNDYSDSCESKNKNGFEQLYVVHQSTVFKIAPVQQVFTFVHPNGDNPPNNDKFCKLNFKVPVDCTLHGFSGSFKAVLHDDITISIVPDQETSAMISWFPVYIPIRGPILLQKGDDVEFNIWRKVSEEEVWYEWCVEKPVTIPIHNLNGRSYAMRLH